MSTNEHSKPHPQVAEKAAEVARYVKQIQSGDKSAFQALYNATEQYIYFCVSSQGVPENDIADVMQEIYLAVYKNLYTIKEPLAAMNWMKRIAFHKSMDYYRRMGKDVLAETITEEFLDVQEDGTLRLPEDVMEKEESGRLVRDLICKLPEKYKRILVMYYFSECSVAEIAKETGVSEGAVKTILYRARKELGKSIETLEKQQGIRLHSVLPVPVLGLLFHKEAQAAQIPATIHGAVTEALAASVTTAGNGTGMATGNNVGAAAKNGTGATAANTMSSAVKNAVASTVRFTAKKWIIAIVAGLCVIGTAALLLMWGDDGTNAAKISENETSSNSTTGHNTVSETTEEPVDKTELFAAYKKLYEDIKANRVWPDESSLGISGDLGEALQYAVQDLDGDGNEELVVSVVTADYMAAYKEKVYKYDPASKGCVEMASVYPLPTYYDNGIIYGAIDESRRFSRAILSFNKESGVYEEIADTQVMSRYEMEFIGLTFPQEADKDGDNSVWLIYDGDREADGADIWNQYDGDKQTYMDNKEGDAWIQGKIGNGKRIEVNYIPFSEGWKY